MFDKLKKLLVSILVIFFSMICLNVRAERSNNFDYEIELNLNGREIASSSIDQLSNAEQAKIIYEYYNNHKNNQKYDSSCVSVFDSNFYSSIITNFASKFFYVILIGSIVVLIVLTMTEFVKAIMSNDQDSLKIAFKRTINRFLAVIILIFTPIIISFIITFVNKLDSNGVFKGMGNSKCNYIDQDKIIVDSVWGVVDLDYADKSGYNFLGWTANKNGPSVIFKSKVDTSLLLKEKLNLYSLFIDSNKDRENFNGFTVHNRGVMFRNFNLTKSNFIKSTASSGFNYYADFDEWYYLSNDGKIYTGMKKIGGKTYYFGNNGALRFGWVKIGKSTYYFNVKGEMVYGEQIIGGVKYHFDEKTGALITNLVMNYSTSVEIPDSLWKKYDSAGDPSIVVADEEGHVLASRKPNVMREGASTTKLFAGYAAVELLDVNNDKVVGSSYINPSSAAFKSCPTQVGQKISVSQAAVKCFPGSSNSTAEDIVIAIGKKYYGSSSDKEAHTNGIKKMNEFYKNLGCKNTHLGNGSGLNYFPSGHMKFTSDHGMPRTNEGHSANDLALVAIYAMKNEKFLNAYVNHSNCEGWSKGCKEKAKDKSKNGIFYIKSGTCYCGHGIWGFNYNSKRYYIALQGVRCSTGDNNKHGAKGKIMNDVHDWVIKNVIDKK